MEVQTKLDTLRLRDLAFGSILGGKSNRPFCYLFLINIINSHLLSDNYYNFLLVIGFPFEAHVSELVYLCKAIKLTAQFEVSRVKTFLCN